MPILNKPSFITKLFSFRKTMTAASATPVPKLGQQASVKQAPAPKQRKAPARTHETHKSIFARITSSFKARRAWGKIKPISKQIGKNMPALKTSIPDELQKIVQAIETQEISELYANDFSDLRATFTDQSGKTTLSESILTSQDVKNPNKSAAILSEYLTNFCGGNKNQASTLKALLTPYASSTITNQLKSESSKFFRRETKKVGDKIDVHMIENNTARIVMIGNNTARIVFTQDYISSTKYKSATIKTTIDVPPETPSSIILDSVDITPTST